MQTEHQIASLAAKLFAQSMDGNHRRTDRLFQWVMLLQWVAGIAAAVVLSPRAWEGAAAHVHVHVWMAVLLGGWLTLLPVTLIHLRPGSALTRHTIAISQMLTSALLIHLSGGRIETHFHIFGSLAFLAIYRDWRTLVTASAITVLDHLLLGLYYPQSLYGVASASVWRTLEHAGWVVFEVIVLSLSCIRGLKERFEIAYREASLEVLKQGVEQEVENRTSQLRASEARFRLLSESLPLGVFQTDAAGNFNYGNPALLEIMGYHTLDLMGMPYMKAIAPGDSESRQEWAEAVDKQTGFTKEFRILRANEEERWIASFATPIVNNEGVFAGHVGSVKDITQRKKTEEEWKRAREAAESANRSKSAFLANVSHEIRTPINGVLGMTELMLDTELTQDQRECIETIQSSTDGLLAVINDLLDFSKVEAGKLDLEEIDFDLTDLLHSSLQVLAVGAHKKHLELTCDIDPDVPESMNGDPGRLRQVIMNLVGNAIKFTQQGEVNLRVELISEPKTGASLRFTVADTGIGIPAEKVGLIFRPFEQADTSTTRRYGGTGLGLSISSRLVEMMGGQIGIESVQGQGTTFHFTAQFRPAKNPEKPRQVSLKDLCGRRVLLVDDNETNRRILTRNLTNWKMHPVPVASGAEALSKILEADQPFDLVLTDLNMPEMDGFHLAKTLRSHPDYTTKPILLLTSGTCHGGYSALCRESGIGSYLQKPIHRHLLLAEIRSAFGSVTETGTGEPKQPLSSVAPSRILLAEDNTVNQKVATRLLQRAGHTVTVAQDGNEALALLSSREFDLVLMDVQMPGRDGLSATAELRRREGGARRVPVIAMTANAMKGDREACLAAGMDGYLSKPFKIDELHATIAEWLPSVPV